MQQHAERRHSSGATPDCLPTLRVPHTFCARLWCCLVSPGGRTGRESHTSGGQSRPGVGPDEQAEAISESVSAHTGS
jgi:hypothetical protein